jgi:hypothetical protein
MYALIKGDEDGNPASLIKGELDLSNVLEEYGIERFEDAAFLETNPDPNYWPMGVAVLIKFEVIVPRSVTTAWTVE